jgi:hypothetical protein
MGGCLRNLSRRGLVLMLAVRRVKELVLMSGLGTHVGRPLGTATEEEG